jgi:eukaryotic-like serine/threonine-protein kinase
MTDLRATQPGLEAAPASDKWKVGDTVSGQFEVLEVLGATPGGTSFKVRTQSGGKVMVLKTVHAGADHDAIYGELREPLKIAARLKHKNLVQVYGLGRDEEIVFVIMEFIEGKTLTRHVAERRSRGEVFNPKGVFNILAHVCNGLAAIHEHSAHGALTPGHVHVSDGGRMKIGNIVYGHTVARGLYPEGLGAFHDSPFTAPEFRRDPGPPTIAGDLYALGMITAELLSPEPLRGLGVAARTAALAISEEYGGGLRGLIAQATDDDPSARVADAVTFRDRLKTICMENVDPRPVTVAAAEADTFDAAPEYQINIGPAPGEEVLADDAPTPPPAGMSLDPFAKAAQILGTGRLPEVGPGTGDHEALTGEQPRYLVSKENLDYGPYTRAQVLEQLRKDDIDEYTVILDRTTQMRTPLGELRTFGKAVREYIPIREDRRRREREQRQQRVEVAKTAGMWTGVVGVVAALLVGALVGGWYFFIRPQPAQLPQEAMFADLAKEYRLEPPPREFNNVAVDDDLLAGLFSKDDPGKIGRGGGRSNGRRNGGKGIARKNPGGRGADSDENISELDLGKDGGSTHVLTDSEINKTIRRGFGGLRGCMLQELKRNPGFKGVSVRFFIRPTGATGGVKIQGASSGGLTSCLKGRFRGMRFPQHGGFNRGVTLPLYIK